MRYFDGTVCNLGDEVELPIPEGQAKCRVVMLGETYEHSSIDQEFLRWVTTKKVLERDSVVLEWLTTNPFKSTNPKYAPVGKYLFSPLSESVRFIERAL
jgi:hypothetical protein